MHTAGRESQREAGHSRAMLQERSPKSMDLVSLLSGLHECVLCSGGEAPFLSPRVSSGQIPKHLQTMKKCEILMYIIPSRHSL